MGFNPHPKQCKVVFYRITGIKCTKNSGNFFHCPPIVLFSLEQSECPAYIARVNIEREHQG